MFINKLASAIYNDIVGGLNGICSTPNLSIVQLEDDIVDERLQVILEFNQKNILPRNSLLATLSCIKTDTKSLDRSPTGIKYTKSQMHFEIPQVPIDNGIEFIEYCGSIDRECQFTVYTNTSYQYHQYLKRGSHRPYVYVEPTPNENNLYDCWAYQCPFLKQVMVTFIPKDPRQIELFDNNLPEDYDNFSAISNEVKKRVTEKKLRYYRQLAGIPTPNTQVAK
jgi:hypothetical protein